MTGERSEVAGMQGWVKEKIFMGMELKDYLKQLITPFNIAAAIIIAIGIPLIILRYIKGLGAVTSGSYDQPFGWFLTWGLFSGVPMASTGFIMAAAVYVFGARDYRPLLRPALLWGFIGYTFAVIFLLVDLGRPWRIPYPMIKSWGFASILFLVAWDVALYTTVQFLEFSPVVAEWLESKALRDRAAVFTVALVILGITISTVHQSALGAMFLLTPNRMHPLWYSPYLPIFFFVSSLYAGLSVVIVESMIVYRFLPKAVDPRHREVIDRLTIGLGKAAAAVLFAYFFLKIVGVARENEWDLMFQGPYGYWFMFELFGLIVLPCFLFAVGARNNDVKLVRIAAIMSIVSLYLNRITVTQFALNWKLAHRHFFEPKELWIVLTIFMIQLLVYRWIVNRLPVHRPHPVFGYDEH